MMHPAFWAGSFAGGLRKEFEGCNLGSRDEALPYCLLLTRAANEENLVGPLPPDLLEALRFGQRHIEVLVCLAIFGGDANSGHGAPYLPCVPILSSGASFGGQREV